MMCRLIRGIVLVIVLSLTLSLSTSPGARLLIGSDGAASAAFHPDNSASGTPPTIYSIQKWARAFGPFYSSSDGWETDIAMAALPVRDGGTVIAGDVSFIPYDSLVERSDIVVMEVRPSGSVSWQVVFEGDPSRQAYNKVSGLIQTSDGGYAVIGCVSKGNGLSRRALVMKLGPLGGVQWVKSYDTGEFDSTARAAVQTEDGGFLVSAQNGAYGTVLLKLDAAGNVKWSRVLGMWLNPIRLTPNGGFVAGGTTGDGTPRLVKLNDQGEIEWQRGYFLDPGWACGDYDSRPYGLWPTSDGGYALAGETWGCSQASWVAWVFLLGQAGDIVRAQIYSDAFPVDFLQCRDGGFLMADPQSLLKLTPDLEIEWQKGFTNFGAYSALETEDRGFLLAGYYKINEGDYPRMAVLCLDSRGMIGRACPLIGNAQVNLNEFWMTTAQVSPVTQSTKKVRVRSIRYAFYPRTFGSETLCKSISGPSPKSHDRP